MNDLTFDKINKANIIRKGETALMIYVAYVTSAGHSLRNETRLFT